MKLTNLSLSILVALGLIACGGSDDNSNAAADNNNAGHQQGGKGGSGGVPEEKKPEQTNNDDKKDDQKSGITPERVAPDLKVPADLQTIVDSRKKSFISRGFSDKALGYDDPNGETYEKGSSTDPANIKWTSTYNFVDQDDVYPTGGNSEGAIYVGADATLEINNAYAKGKDGRYYRVAAAAGPYKKDTKFKLVAGVGAEKDNFGNASAQTNIDQDKVVFIANANADIVTLGKSSGGFDKTGSQVILNTVSTLGTTYNAYSTGQELNLSKLPVKKEIQTVDVTGQYSIINGKDTPKAVDDKVIVEDIKLGHIKAYNLPYSAAYVTTDASGESEKNIFNFKDTEAFQVVGMQTVSLPKNGRAFYKGKSFSATTEGDVDLVADFFSDRAGIVGAVTNRKDIVKNKALPELTLNRVELTTPDQHFIGGKSAVQGGEAGYTHWAVGLYGLEAQEAAGVIGTGVDYQSGKFSGTVKEVFNTQRGALSNNSNDSQ